VIPNNCEKIIFITLYFCKKIFKNITKSVFVASATFRRRVRPKKVTEEEAGPLQVFITNNKKGRIEE